MRVEALIGPSGTGKSHRAFFLAKKRGLQAVIDDGLLIYDGKILAGRSAKREATRLGAVKRAVFADPLQAAEVKEAISSLDPEGLLILGTSIRMADKIAAALELPKPSLYHQIEEIATDEEINTARRIRLEQGKHVIPAPTFEVKKTFSGYLIDPLRFFVGGRPDRQYVEKSVVRPTFSSLGSFYIADTVVADLANRAMRDVEGVERPLRISVVSSEEGVHINIEVSLFYGYDMRQVMRKAQHRVKGIVEYTTALNVLSVNITVKRVLVGGQDKERVESK